jgi:DNA-binding response OmpR family regulator/DNA-binding CsgD family transcriptional regulator
MNDILIIDDTPENLTVLLQILTAHGYQVRPALSGEIALKAVQEDIPDLILLDIMMPGMDGFEVCSKLKSDTRTQDIPIIFISALGDTEDKIKGFQAGGVDYITKPFHAAEVLARIETHLALRNMQLQLLREIGERKLAEEDLQQAHVELEQRVADRTAELNRKTERLTETNIALKILLEKREEDKKELQEKVMFNIEKLIFPYLEKLKKRCDNESQKALMEIIRSNLAEITSSFVYNYKDYLSNLTPNQIQIADLIKQGQTTKEIASLLNLSPSTIACHRQEIRRRLSLTNKKINLQAALTANLDNN